MAEIDRTEGETTDFVYERELSFAETDAGGVGHFSCLLCLVEEAEHRFLRSRGFDLYGGKFQWPRVHVEADYSAPVRAGDLLKVHLSLQNVGNSSLRWGFSADGPKGTVMRGHLVTVRLLAGEKAPFSAEERSRLLSPEPRTQF